MKYLLGVDVGNTHTRFALLEEHTTLDQVRFATRPSRTTKEVQSILAAFLAPHGGPNSLLGACIASVVPAVDDALGKALGQTRTHFVTHQSALGYSFSIEKPEQIGADRLVNAAGALSVAKPPLVLIDAGTAITVCAVAPGPTFLGGAIAPGPAMAAEALSQRTAQLPEIQLKPPPFPAGRTTVEALQSGVVLGLAGLIEGLVVRLKEQLGGSAEVLATGGAMELFGDHLRGIDQTIPELTMRGLAAIAQNEGLLS